MRAAFRTHLLIQSSCFCTLSIVEQHALGIFIYCNMQTQRMHCAAPAALSVAMVFTAVHRLQGVAMTKFILCAQQFGEAAVPLLLEPTVLISSIWSGLSYRDFELHCLAAVPSHWLTCLVF